MADKNITLIAGLRRRSVRMAEYDRYFDDFTGTWKVIKKEEFGGYWFNYVPNAGDELKAKEIAEGLNERERRY